MVVQYLGIAKNQAPAVYGFERFLAERPGTVFELGFLDVWLRFFAPQHPWRYKLNAVIAIHECDAKGYQDLRRTRAGAFRTWISIAALGLQYLCMVAAAFCWVGYMYVLYGLSRLSNG